jgi:histidyl-tRNA synthetase
MTKTIQKTQTKTLSEEHFLKKSSEVALYYGFRPFQNWQEEAQEKLKNIEDKHRRKEVLERNQFSFSDCEEKKESEFQSEKLKILSHYIKHSDLLSSPALCFWHGRMSHSTVAEGAPLSVFSLEAISGAKSATEAILIRTAKAILDELHYKNLNVHINTLGDKESFGRFEKELSNFYKKNNTSLAPHCRNLLKKDLIKVHTCTDENCLKETAGLRERAPKPMSFLNEASRTHFGEILEFLEGMSIPYQIKHGMMTASDTLQKTMFEIHSDADTDEDDQDELNDQLKISKTKSLTLAIGNRYDALSRKLGLRKEIPAVGISIFAATSYEKKLSVTIRTRRPQVYFIQLGFDAKRRSLEVIELLRQARIPLHQNVIKDKLTAQLDQAEKMKIPYILIMGQKEAIEGSCIVRNMTTHSQETVSISLLPFYLKHLEEALV